MDESNTGTITRSDLASSIHDLYNITLSPAQLDALCLSFGISGSTSDSVNYSKFVDVVRDLATLQPLTSSSYGAGNDLHQDTLADHPWDGATFKRLGIVAPPAEATPDQIIRCIYRKIRSRSSSTSKMQNTFLHMDTHRSNAVTVTEFREFLKNVGLLLSPAQIATALAPYLSGNPSAPSLRFADFSAFLLSMEPSREVMPWEKLDEETLKRERTVAQHLARTAKAAMQHAVSKAADDALSDSAILESMGETLLYKKTSLVKAFKRFDTDNSGTLSVDQFKEGLFSCGIDISKDKAEEIITKYDVNKNGTIACWEFVRMMNSHETDDDETNDDDADAEESKSENKSADSLPGAVPTASASVPASDVTLTLTDFKAGIAAERKMLRSVFKKIAQGGKTINAAQFQVCLEKMNPNITPETATRIMEKFDLDGTGELHYFEFLKMMNTVGS
jgi:Ca2+-binding EF-hand superfamily protein